MSLAVWLEEHSQAVEASLDRYYRADLRDWYRGRMTARWLWSRLVNLPADSPLVISVGLEPNEPDESTPAAELPWPPTNLMAIPVAKSFAHVGSIVSGADLN